jgi:RNA polymerase sigma-70 factor, ECF subfamily
MAGGDTFMSEPIRPTIDVEEFVGLLMASERRVFSYILTLLPNVADAQDVLQEASIVLWRRLAEYERGTDFSAWACRVALNVVRNFRAKQHRCRVKFDEQLFTAVASDAESMRQELDVAQAALFDCVNELPPGDRDLLQRRYEVGATIKSVAAAVGRSAEGLYKAMRRIHDALHDCIQHRLKSEGIHVRKS